MNYKEALDNDIIVSGDLVAFPGTTWKERLLEGVTTGYHSVGIVYIPDKDNRYLYQFKPFKSVVISNLDDVTFPFTVVKTGMPWNKKVYAETRMPIGERYGYFNAIFATFSKNDPFGNFFTSTYAASILNAGGYRLSLLGCTPTELVQDLLNLGRKKVEITNE